jgi:hypothetical protein
MEYRGGESRKGMEWEVEEDEEWTVGSCCTSHEQGGVANATADRRGLSPAIMAARREQGTGAGAVIGGVELVGEKSITISSSSSPPSMNAFAAAIFFFKLHTVATLLPSPSPAPFTSSSKAG